MKLSKDLNILIIGLGLMGGSYAKALKEKGYKVSAITKKQSDAEYALANGFADIAVSTVDEQLVATADLVIFALYPHVFVEWINNYQHLFKSGAVISDVTGVKGCIVGKIQSVLRPDVEFIAAHPMAGREQSGIEFADSSIFKVANYIVTPTEKNSKEAVSLCRDLGETLGFARISELSPDRHDEIIAFLSQLTHCIAVCLMCSSDDHGLVNYTGDSFRDLTRIARINDEMWSELFLDNKTALLKQMEIFKVGFGKMYTAVKNGDREGLREMMRTSTERRGWFDR